jgi:tRNA-dihydrouridine synthase A
MESTIQYESKMNTKGTKRREYFSVAPMVDVTDIYFRQLMRYFTRRAFLYTEMVSDHNVLGAARDRLIAYTTIQHPIVL